MYILELYQEKVKAVGFHSLLNREIRPERNWHELMENWEAAATYGDMLGILHRGFNVPMERGSFEDEYDQVDRLIFYFMIADGWADYHLLRLPEDQGKEYCIGYDKGGSYIKKDPCELRQQVAGKAFDMLAINFFKKTEESRESRCIDGFNEKWEKVISSERLFLIVQHFFRIQEKFGGRMSIRNLSHSHHDDKLSHQEAQAVSFLLNLARFIWKWKEEKVKSWQAEKDKDATRKRNIEMRSRLDAAKPWMIEVLAWLGRLDVLRERMLEFDKPCLNKLKEIAFRARFSQFHNHVGEDRLVVSLDEACYLGSNAAWFLKKHELMSREKRRLEGIREAKLKRVAADREIKKLTAAK
jgi:hypothetical protein